DKDMPVSVSLGVGYQKLYYSSDTLSALGSSIDSWSLLLNGSVYRFIRLGDKVGVIPSAGVTFAHNSSSVDGFFPGNSTSDDIGVTLGANFAFLDGGGRIWGVAPQIEIGDSVTFSVEVGVIFSLL